MWAFFRFDCWYRESNGRSDVTPVGVTVRPGPEAMAHDGEPLTEGDSRTPLQN